MSPPVDTRTKVRARIMDLSDTNPLLLDGTTLDEAITQAISHYSNDRPREVTAEVTGTGSGFYPLTGVSTVLASWSNGFSTIVGIDFPATPVAAGYQPRWLDKDLDWTIYADATLFYLWFLNQTPTATQKARVTYTALHVHTTALDTVPAADLDGLCDLAAHYACQALATKMAASSDSLISADSTNYRDGQLRFSQQAKAWLDSYKTKLGIKDGVAGASSFVDWNRRSTTGWPWLTHNRRWGR